MKVKVGDKVLEFPESMSSDEVAELLGATFEAKTDHVAEQLIASMTVLAEVFQKTAESNQQALTAIIKALPDGKPMAEAMAKQNKAVTTAMVSMVEKMDKIASRDVKLEIPPAPKVEAKKEWGKLHVVRSADGFIEDIVRQ